MIVLVGHNLVPKACALENVLAPFPKFRICAPRVGIPQVRVLVRISVARRDFGVGVNPAVIGKAIDVAIPVNHILHPVRDLHVLVIEDNVVRGIHLHSDIADFLQESARALLAAAKDFLRKRVEVDVLSDVVAGDAPFDVHSFKTLVYPVRAFNSNRAAVQKIVRAVVVGNVNGIKESSLPLVLDQIKRKQGGQRVPLFFERGVSFHVRPQKIIGEVFHVVAAELLHAARPVGRKILFPQKLIERLPVDVKIPAVFFRRDLDSELPCVLLVHAHDIRSESVEGFPAVNVLVCSVFRRHFLDALSLVQNRPHDAGVLNHFDLRLGKKTLEVFFWHEKIGCLFVRLCFHFFGFVFHSFFLRGFIFQRLPAFFVFAFQMQGKQNPSFFPCFPLVPQSCLLWLWICRLSLFPQYCPLPESHSL